MKTYNNITNEEFNTVNNLSWSSMDDSQKRIYSAYRAGVDLENKLAEFDILAGKVKRATKGKLTLVRIPYESSAGYEEFGSVEVQLTHTGLKLATWSQYTMSDSVEAFLIGVSFS